MGDGYVYIKVIKRVDLDEEMECKMNEKQQMEKDEEEKKQGKEENQRLRQQQQQQPPPNISPMEPVTRGAYGGGMYGTEAGQPEKPRKPPASDTQSADGPAEPEAQPKHKPPPSSGDRDIDITGQSYIQ